MPEFNPQVIIPSERSKKVRLIIIITLIFLVALFFTFLYFNKNQVPSQNSTQAVPKSTEIQISCPSAPDFCKQAKEITKNGHLAGIGANIGKDSSLFAVFDGNIRVLKMTKANSKEKLIDIVLISQDQKNVATYIVKGLPTPPERFYKKGDVILPKLGDGMSYYDNNNFVFNLLDSGNQPIPLNKIMFTE